MNYSPKVFAVIPIRNRKDKTLRFLKRFIDQTYENLHIVLVDANSTDGTQDVIVSLYPQVTLIDVDDECYWTASTNKGIEYSLNNQADFILTINDDSYVDINYVRDLVGLAIKYDTDILGSRIDYMDHPGLIWSLGSYSNWGTKNILQLSYNKCWIDNLPHSIADQEVIKVEALAGNGVLIKKTVFKKIGLYNEKFLPHYHADSELIMRAVKNSIQPFASTNVVVYNDCVDFFGKPQYSWKQALTYPIRYAKDFFVKRNHVYFIPIIYITLTYCPLVKKIPTLISFFFISLFIPLKEVTLIRTRIKRFLSRNIMN